MEVVARVYMNVCNGQKLVTIPAKVNINPGELVVIKKSNKKKVGVY